MGSNNIPAAMSLPHTGPITFARAGLAPATLTLLLAAVVLIAHPAAEHSLWFDEAWSVRAIESREVAAIFQAVRHDYHSPAYFLALSAWSSAAGDSERALRHLTALSALLTTALTYRLAADLFPGRRAYRVAALSAIALATAPLHIRFAHEARMYAMLATGVAASMLLLWRYMARPRRRVAAAYVVVTAATTYLQYLGFFILAVQAAYLAGRALLKDATREQTARAFALLGVSLALFAPWLPTFLAQLRSPMYEPAHRHALPSNIDTLVFLLTQHFAAGQTALYVALIVIALVTVSRTTGSRRPRLHNPRATSFLAIWLVGWMALTFASNALVPQLQPRNTVPALVPWAILAGCGMARLPAAIRTAASCLPARTALHHAAVKQLARAGVGVALVVMVAGNLAGYAAYQQSDPHYRQAVAELARSYQPGDLIFLQTNSELHDLPLPLYLDRLIPGHAPPAWLNHLPGGPGSTEAARAFAAQVGEARRFWLLQTLPVDNNWIQHAVPHAPVSDVHIDAFKIALYEATDPP